MYDQKDMSKPNNNLDWNEKIGVYLVNQPVDKLSLNPSFIAPELILELVDLSSQSIGDIELIIIVLSQLSSDEFSVISEQIRVLRESSNIPIAAYGKALNGAEKVALINAGLNEFISPEDSVNESLAKLRSLVRRYSYDKLPPPDQLVLSDCVIDFGARQITLHGESSPLSPIEYRMLKYFQQHPNMLLTHQQIFAYTWGADKLFDSHYVSLYIGKIRKLIGDSALEPRWIVSDKGLGYRFMGQS
jgi:two-component system KDP operon response regulator KdpE